MSLLVRTILTTMVVILVLLLALRDMNVLVKIVLIIVLLSVVLFLMQIGGHAVVHGGQVNTSAVMAAISSLNQSIASVLAGAAKIGHIPGL